MEGGKDGAGWPRTLLIRADASPRIGTGHVMRCLALAQGWRRYGGEAVFACAEITPALEQPIRAERFELIRITGIPGSAEDAAETSRLALELAPPAPVPLPSDLRPPTSDLWLVADGYRFDAAYQRAIKAAGWRLLLFDDYGHADHYYADYVLNQNLHADEKLYANREPYTRLLLGTRYALLREEFLKYRDWQREIPAVARKVLVTLGGSDADNVTGKVIESLRGLDVEAKIVVGGSNPHLEQLRSQVSAFTRHPSSFILLTDVSNMPELMAWADVAVSAGGTTAWELAFMGLPSLVVVLAENQALIAEALDRQQITTYLGRHGETNAARITAAVRLLSSAQSRRVMMSREGRRRVDGDGSDRVVRTLKGDGPQEVPEVATHANLVSR